MIRADSAEMATRAFSAIQNGGISVIEITMTVPGAIDIIKSLANRPDNKAIIGAGTVLDKQSAQACVSAGAQFIVTPILKLEVIEYCTRVGIAVMPGSLTPTEVFEAWTAGADLVKVFPASASGGASYIKALKAPLPQIPLVPTGGVSIETAADFIRAGAAALGVGGNLVDIEALGKDQDQVISDRARQFVRIIREARESIGSAQKDKISKAIGIESAHQTERR